MRRAAGRSARVRAASRRSGPSAAGCGPAGAARRRGSTARAYSAVWSAQAPCFPGCSSTATVASPEQTAGGHAPSRGSARGGGASGGAFGRRARPCGRRRGGFTGRCVRRLVGAGAVLPGVLLYRGGLLAGTAGGHAPSRGFGCRWSGAGRGLWRPALQGERRGCGWRRVDVLDGRPRRRYGRRAASAGAPAARTRGCATPGPARVRNRVRPEPCLCGTVPLRNRVRAEPCSCGTAPLRNRARAGLARARCVRDPPAPRGHASHARRAPCAECVRRRTQRAKRPLFIAPVGCPGRLGAEVCGRSAEGAGKAPQGPPR